LLRLLGGTAFAEWYPVADMVAALRHYSIREMLDLTEEEWLTVCETLVDNQEMVLSMQGVFLPRW